MHCIIDHYPLRNQMHLELLNSGVITSGFGRLLGDLVFWGYNQNLWRLVGRRLVYRRVVIDGSIYLFFVISPAVDTGFSNTDETGIVLILAKIG